MTRVETINKPISVDSCELHLYLKYYIITELWSMNPLTGEIFCHIVKRFNLRNLLLNPFLKRTSRSKISVKQNKQAETISAIIFLSKWQPRSSKYFKSTFVASKCCCLRFCVTLCFLLSLREIKLLFLSLLFFDIFVVNLALRTFFCIA